MTETIDHATLAKLAEAGAVNNAEVVGCAGGWGIRIKQGATERILAAQHSQQARVFREFEVLVAYLTGIGILRFEVNAENYAPASPAATNAAYETWLKAEVQEALDDPNPAVAHDEAMRQIRAAIKLP